MNNMKLIVLTEMKNTLAVDGLALTFGRPRPTAWRGLVGAAARPVYRPIVV